MAALSARLLAQSARRAGWSVVALDLFGDVDTCAATTRWEKIGDPAAMCIDGERFIAALAAVGNSADCAGWIAGAGFEARPDLLDAGARLLPLLGNDRATVEPVRHPRKFFAALAQLGIAHPDTTFEAPSDGRGWLMKDFAASGGWHVRRAPFERKREVTTGTYFQREIGGRPMSLLFVATGARALPLGFNELLVRAHGTRPYVYHGAIGPIVDLPPSAAAGVCKALAALLQVFALRGLGSLDFILHGETFSVLELNPRPTSTMALYDPLFEAGLVKLHVDACGVTPPNELAPVASGTLRGELTIFATCDVLVAREQVAELLALGCHDVPQPQLHIAAGAPLCSVSAHGATVDEVRAALAEMETRALSIVQNRNEAFHHAS